MELIQWEKELTEELTGRILPFWSGMRDEVYGGYYGRYTYDHKLEKEAVKGCILNNRILWFFSRAYGLLGEEKIRKEADHAYEFLRDYCYDKEQGGVYWSVTYDGKPEDTTKHTYNQAFAVYALSEYYGVTKRQEALDLAYTIYQIIEGVCSDEGGYLEAFDRGFEPAGNDKLSENGVEAKRTMNTTLHVLEAYTALYRVTKDQEVKAKLEAILDTILTKIYNPAKKRQEVFFDNDWNTIIDLYSYGHDIETTWLVDLALEQVQNPKYTEQFAKVNAEIMDQLYEVAFDGHSLNDECCNGEVNTTKIWWVQAESIMGFYNAYEHQPSETRYLEAAQSVWEYIKKHIIDQRPDSEWLGEVFADDSENTTHDIVGMWKCPYHNGRMCMEMMERLALAKKQ